MYRPHYCEFLLTKGGFDEDHNPVVGSAKPTGRYPCYLVSPMPKEIVNGSDGQSVENLSGVIYLDRFFFKKNKLPLKIGDSVIVYSKDLKPIFKGSVVSFRDDEFHSRVWV